MRSPLWLFAAVLPLSACSTPATGAGPTAPAELPAPAGADAPRCDEAVLQKLVGQTATQAVVDKAVRDTGAKHARVVKPDMMVTMDYRADRLTLNVDANNVIERAGCN